MASFVQSLSEEVRRVPLGGNVQQGDALLVDQVTQEEMAQLDVFGARMEDRICCEEYGTLVVTVDWDARDGEA